MIQKTTKRIFQTAAAWLLAVIACGNLQAGFLPNNFMPNPGFESGTNLDAIDGSGTPAGWTRTGGDPTLCQVLNANSVSPTHSLALVDNTFDYAEWDSDHIPLAGHANPGDSVVVQWSELYSINPGGEMRVTVDFFDVNTNLTGETHSVVHDQSPGWTGAIAGSTFTLRSETLVVPSASTQIRVSLVSGGSGATEGVMLIDDLSVAPLSTPELLTGNFWPNPSFELGTNLNTATNAVPTGWNSYNSGSSIICQVTGNNYVSASHALASVDNDPNNYGSWYSDQVSIVGHANPGDTLNLQWFELYSITNGEMRVVFTFFNAGGGGLGDINYVVNGNSAGWQGAVAGSGFTKRNQQLVVPNGAVKIGVQVVSGGPSATTGIFLFDDLSMATPPAPPILAGNFWPNSTFESGVNLNQTNGVPTGWRIAGNDTNICQVTTNNYNSATHALALIDNGTNNYGEWDSDLVLGTNASPGDTLTIQWAELYSVTNGPMRVTVLFLDSSSNQLSQTDANATGNSSGWAGQVIGSSFGLHNVQAMVPYKAAILRISVVSGGPQAATGVYLIDDLSVARLAYPATVLSYDFFPNPTFESGIQLDNPTGALPAGGWQRGGSSAAIDQVSTNNSVSSSHSLALVDNDPLNYGEWYVFYNTVGLIGDNDAVDVQWYQIYSVTNGNMRLSFAFLDSLGNTLWGQDFNTQNSTNTPGWTGSASTSPFQKVSQRFVVPPGTSQLRVNFASGGSATVTGVMLLDDLSVRLSQPLITGITKSGSTYSQAWNSMSSKQYSIEFATNLINPSWSIISSNVPGNGLSTTNVDAVVHPGKNGYYRVIQQ